MPDAPLFTAASDDALLVKRVTRGEMNAFKQLITQYEKLVCSIVFKMIDQKEDREDLCQEVFLKVYDRLSSFRFGSKLSTWIGAIAFNQCVNFLQKRKTVLLDDLYYTNEEDEDGVANERTIDIVDNSKPADELLLNKEKESLLIKSIEKLSPIHRLVLQLFHQHELSLEEIATITAMPVNTVKSHLFRARKIVKNEMTKLLNG
jgi:RNA polymerase sigma-70 factor (ECF subfamily)